MKPLRPVYFRTGSHGTALCVVILAVAAAGCAKPAVTAPLPEAPLASSTAEHEAPQATEVGGDHPPAGDALYKTVSLRGRVVWTTEALNRHFNIGTVPEAKESSLALESNDGRIYPLVEDRQGRAFRRDERLRNRDVELLARFYPAAGMIQVIRVFFIRPDGKYLVDYWCDICSISMVEDGPCDCCQQPNRLREQLVE